MAALGIGDWCRQYKGYHQRQKNTNTWFPGERGGRYYQVAGREVVTVHVH